MNVIPRLALLPCSAFYLYLSMVSDQSLALFAAGGFMTALIILVLRGINEEISPVEAGSLWLIALSAFLSAVPTLASIHSPGLCTDQVATYEIAMLFSIYGGIILGAHQLSKHFLPADMKAMSKPRARRFMSVPGHSMWILTLPFLATGYLMFSMGTCAADNPYLLSFPLMSLFPIGLVAFLVGGITRNQKAIVKSKMEFA
jgi:hypothetical protein